MSDMTITDINHWREEIMIRDAMLYNKDKEIAALLTYSEHQPACPCYKSRFTDSARTPEMRAALAAQCTCGLSALRAEIERVKGGK